MELKVEKKLDEKEVAKLVTNVEEVTDEKIEKSLNYENLTSAEKKAVDEFNEKLDVEDSTQVLQFGAAAQNKISGNGTSQPRHGCGGPMEQRRQRPERIA